MKKVNIASISLLSALLISTFHRPVHSSTPDTNARVDAEITQIKQSGNIQQQCATPLAEAVRRIEDVKNVSVAGIYERDISQAYVDYPADSPVGITISMDGSGTPNIMASPQLLTSIAAQVITKCQPVSLVIIGENQSDNYGVFGLMDEDVVVFRECGSDIGPLNWGEVGCL